MKAFYTDEFVLPLPSGHRFPMAKYALLREAVRAAGLVDDSDLLVPPRAGDADLQRAHCPEYVERASAGRLSAEEVRRLGFPWSPALVERSRRSAGATIEACRAALRDGAAVNLAGGTHHAFRNRGAGYCLYNDGAIAARTMLDDRLVQKVAIVDLDVHQGDGTASICQGDERIVTFSMHGQRCYPYRKETSTLDVGLPNGADDEEYLAALDKGLRQVLMEGAPDLVLYLAGADPYLHDRLGRLALTRGGLAERDRIVFQACRRKSIPVAVAMAGGYARWVEDTVAIHLETVALARRIAIS